MALERTSRRASERPVAGAARAGAPEPPSHGQLRLFARRIVLLSVVAVFLLVLGAVGLALSEGVSLWYAFRWALDTAATVGGFAQPRTVAGQVVEVALVVVGVGTLFYALATITEFFVAGHLGELLAERRMQRTIDSLTHHHIICGFGRVGRQVARDLRAADARCVVVDASAEGREAALAQQLPFIGGDASDDAVLIHAGIERALSIIACADSDADNVFITLSARGLRADVPIVARAAVEDTEPKLLRAGADRVISPYKASGTVMARLALHPQLSGVVDVDAEYRMEEIRVDEGCAGAGQTVGDVQGGSIVVGLRRGREFAPQPPADTQLRGGDVIVAMGTPAALERLETLFAAVSQRR